MGAMNPSKKVSGAPILSPADIRAAALDYLGRFAATRQRLRTILKRRALKSAQEKGIDPAPLLQAIEETIQWLEEKGLQSDQAYAEGKARSLAERGRSSRHIAGHLLAKGVDAELAKETIQTLLSDNAETELELARRYAKKRRLGPYRADGKLPPSSQQKRDLAALARAGFPLEIARRALQSEDED